MDTIAIRQVEIHVLKHDGPHILIAYPRVQDFLRRVLDRKAVLLWVDRGRYGILSHARVENALTPDCQSDLWWEQCLFVPYHVGDILLQYAKEFSDPTGPSEPGSSSESNQNKPES